MFFLRLTKRFLCSAFPKLSCGFCCNSMHAFWHWSRHTKWDETTVTTTLNPGGATDPVRSTWSVMIVRILFRVVWHSGKAMEFRIAARSCNKFCLVGSSLAHVLAFFALVLAANH